MNKITIIRYAMSFLGIDIVESKRLFDTVFACASEEVIHYSNVDQEMAKAMRFLYTKNDTGCAMEVWKVSQINKPYLEKFYTNVLLAIANEMKQK